MADQLYAIDAQHGPARLYGYIANPVCERGNARQQYLFLNGRWIRDRSLGHALQEGYRGLLMTGRYAVAFLFLEVPPDMVDVNVHPTKAEVRFRDAQALYSFVLATVRDRLRAENLTARIRPPNPFAGNVPLFQPRPSETPGSLFPPCRRSRYATDPSGSAAREPAPIRRRTSLYPPIRQLMRYTRQRNGPGERVRQWSGAAKVSPSACRGR